MQSLTPGAARQLADLPDSEWAMRERIPPAVMAVAGRALRSARHAEAPGEAAAARVLSRSGRWVAPHGMSLVADGRRRAAVIIEPAPAAG